MDNWQPKPSAEVARDLTRALQLIAEKPMTAYQLAAKMSCHHFDVLEAFRAAAWEQYQQVGGGAPGSGWLYQPRMVMTKPVREFGMFNDVGISRRNW